MALSAELSTLFLLMLPTGSNGNALKKNLAMALGSEDNALDNLRNRTEQTEEFFRQPDNALELNYFWTRGDNVTVIDGPNFLLLKCFQEKSGLRATYYKSNIQGSYDEEIQLLRKGMVDVSANDLFLLSDRYSFGDYTTPVSSTPFCIVLRRSKFMSFAKVLQLPYQLHVWIAILCSYIFGFFIWHFTCLVRNRTESDYYKHPDMVLSLVHVVQIVFTGTCGAWRTVQRVSQQLMVGALIFFSLVVNSGFQGQLLGFITSPPRLPEPMTIEEAAQVLTKVFSHGSPLLNVEINERKDALKQILSKVKEITYSSSSNELKEVLENEGYGLLTDTRFYFFVSGKKELVGKNQFYIVPECIITPGHGAFMMSKTWSKKKYFSVFVMRVMQGGLYDHWLSAQRHQMDASGITVPRVKEEPTRKPRPLSMKQMSGACTLLQMGLSVALVVFILELFYHHMSLRQLFISCLLSRKSIPMPALKL